MRLVCSLCLSLLDGHTADINRASVGPHRCAVCGLSCDGACDRSAAQQCATVDNKRSEEIHYRLAKKLATETAAEARGAAVAKCGP